jgi:starch phosphorylase
MPASSLPPLGSDEASLGADFLRYFRYTLGRDEFSTSRHHLYLALAYTLRDRLMVGGNETRHAYERAHSRRTCYLSMEFLLGRTLGNALLNLDLEEPVHGAIEALGLGLCR